MLMIFPNGLIAALQGGKFWYNYLFVCFPLEFTCDVSSFPAELLVSLSFHQFSFLL